MNVGNLTFPDCPGLLKDPCVWIADSGATTHSTPYCKNVTGNNKAAVGASLTMGNGDGEAITGYGDVTGTVCDKSGNTIQKTALKDVSLCPGGAYNLFSLTKMIELGWKLTGDKN